MNFGINRGVTAMELIEVITSKENLNRAYKKVVSNKGASGVDGITVEELGAYIRGNKVANSRAGLYKQSGMNVVNFIISPNLLENKIKDGAGLLNPLNYYLRNVGI